MDDSRLYPIRRPPSVGDSRPCRCVREFEGGLPNQNRALEFPTLPVDGGGPESGGLDRRSLMKWT
jgi:hypothetical protein